MIAALLTGIAMSPWMRAALRYGALAMAVLLFLLSIRRSGERSGRLAERLDITEKAGERRPVTSNAKSSTLRLSPRDRADLAQRLQDGELELG